MNENFRTALEMMLIATVVITVGWTLLIAQKRLSVWLLRGDLRRLGLAPNSTTVTGGGSKIHVRFDCHDAGGRKRGGEAEVTLLLVDIYWDKGDRPGEDQQESVSGATQPIPKEVLLRGWNRDDLRRSLAEFEKKHREELRGQLRTDIHPLRDSAVRLVLPSGLDGTLFMWLVNYLQYAKGPNNTRPSDVVVGRAVLDSSFESLPSESRGKEALIYVPTEDVEGDLVFVKVDSGAFEVSFARSDWKSVEGDRLPAGIASLTTTKPVWAAVGSST